MKTQREKPIEARTRSYALVLICTPEGLMLPVDAENVISVFNDMISTEVNVDAGSGNHKFVNELKCLVRDISLTNIEFPLSYEPMADGMDGGRTQAQGKFGNWHKPENLFVTLFIKGLPETSDEFTLVPYGELSSEQRFCTKTAEVLDYLGDAIKKTRRDFFAAAPAPVPVPAATAPKEMKMTRPVEAAKPARTRIPNALLDNNTELTVVIPLCGNQRLAGSASVPGHWTAFHERLSMPPFSKFAETDALRLAKKIPSFTGEPKEIGTLTVTDGEREITVQAFVAMISSTSQAQINTHLRTIAPGELVDEAHRYDPFSLDLYAKLDSMAQAALEQKAS